MQAKTFTIKPNTAHKGQKKHKNGEIKVFVDSVILEKASKALFDFDIEKYVSKKDLHAWKK